MINSFNTNIAKDFSLDSSVFMQQLAQWIFYNLANEKNIFDGLCWSFNTLKAYGLIFPWWTKKQLERIIYNVVSQGLVVKGCYNKTSYDRTVWYAITTKGLHYYPELTTLSNLKLMASSISPNGEIYFSELINLFPQKETTIPTNKTTTEDISKDISSSSSFSLSPSSSRKSKDLCFEDLKSDNPHEIPEHMLIDWISIRKQKKSKITRTAWIRMNKVMEEIKRERRISPLTAFETMVMNCWQSLDLKYFKENDVPTKRSDNPNHIDNLQWIELC